LAGLDYFLFPAFQALRAVALAGFLADAAARLAGAVLPDLLAQALRPAGRLALDFLAAGLFEAGFFAADFFAAGFFAALAATGLAATGGTGATTIIGLRAAGAGIGAVIILLV
jgi:hypothetical protein